MRQRGIAEPWIPGCPDAPAMLELVSRGECEAIDPLGEDANAIRALAEVATEILPFAPARVGVGPMHHAAIGGDREALDVLIIGAEAIEAIAQRAAEALPRVPADRIPMAPPQRVVGAPHKAGDRVVRRLHAADLAGQDAVR